MLHGLLWFPLLFFFFWLAWAGWNEYQKLEAYRAWAQQFERAKYDIYAVLGQRGNDLTWGKPTRKEPVELQTFSLEQVRSLQLSIDGVPVNLDSPKESGKNITIVFQLPDSTIQVPFTDASIAVQWAKFLQQKWQLLSNKE